jgi:Subtilase family
MQRSPLVSILAAGGAVVAALLLFLIGRGDLSLSGWKRPQAELQYSSDKPKDKFLEGEKGEDEEQQQEDAADQIAGRIKKKLQDLVLDLGEGENRKGQVVVKFSNDAEYHEFLKKLDGSGMTALNRNAGLRAVLVGTDSLNKLRDFLGANPNLNPELTSNPLLQAPTPLDSKDPNSSGSDAPFTGNGVRNALGAATVAANAGSGVNVAVLDSAVANLPVFQGGLSVANSPLSNPTADLSHGTAVAYLFKELAPGVNVHSYPVVGADGMSDAFTISDAIMQAVNNGANVINISLGSYQDNSALAEAVNYAKTKGVVIVASAGNEGLNNATYPARYPGVVSAIAGDANGQSATFSNTSSNYGFTAPGVGVVSINSAGERVVVDGTSFSSPLLGSMIANVMSGQGVTAYEAVTLLQTTSNDAGAAGPDAVYGYGWPQLSDVANRSTAGILDGRMASNHLNTANGRASMDYVVQNNGTAVMNDWQLNVDTNGVQEAVVVPQLLPNQSWTYSVPITSTGSQMSFSSQVSAPAGVSDVGQGNNGLRTVLTPLTK